MKYAIVKNSLVINIVEWDGESEYTVDGELVQADDKAHIGGTYDGSSFSAPAALVDNRTYAEKRAVAYPTIGDQLDMLWHAIDVGDWTPAKVKTTEFYTALKTVKDANPKP